MEKFIVILVTVLVVGGNYFMVEGNSEGHVHEVSCSNSDRARREVMAKSQCGEPKEVFVTLTPRHTAEQVIPGAVWLKRCVGSCDYESGENITCAADRQMTIDIPVKVFNLSSKRHTCVNYSVQEHLSCRCCNRESCPAPQVFNASKCRCKCPNIAERRKCLNQNKKWNRLKCECKT